MTGPRRLPPRRARRSFGPQCGDPVVWRGRVWLLVGRTMSGAWLLLPPASWGTGAARRERVFTAERPEPLPRNVVPIGPRTRDRRGAWSRRS